MVSSPPKFNQKVVGELMAFEILDDYLTHFPIEFFDEICRDGPLIMMILSIKFHQKNPTIYPLPATLYIFIW